LRNLCVDIFLAVQNLGDFNLVKPDDLVKLYKPSWLPLSWVLVNLRHRLSPVYGVYGPHVDGWEGNRYVPFVHQMLEKVLSLVRAGDVLVSAHGYDELDNDSIRIQDLIENLGQAEVIEDYPQYPKGPCALMLQRDLDGSVVHALWGIPHGRERPAVLVTAYRPDPTRWSADFRSRSRNHGCP